MLLSAPGRRVGPTGDQVIGHRRPIVLALMAGLAAGLLSACTGSATAGRPAKISPDLLALHASYREARRTGAEFHPRGPLLRIVEDRVLIDAAAAGDARALEADLVALGLRHAAAFGRLVSGELPIAAIPALGTLASLAFARASASSRAPGPAEQPSRP